MHELEVEIDKEGNIKTHIKGIPGAACTGVEKLLLDAFGSAKASKPTLEYYQPAKTKVAVKA